MAAYYTPKYCLYSETYLKMCAHTKSACKTASRGLIVAGNNKDLLQQLKDKQRDSHKMANSSAERIIY